MCDLVWLGTNLSRLDRLVKFVYWSSGTVKFIDGDILYSKLYSVYLNQFQAVVSAPSIRIIEGLPTVWSKGRQITL